MTAESIDSSDTRSVSELKRKILELETLYEISQALNFPATLEDVMSNIMPILHRKMEIERGILALLDHHTGDLMVQVGYGIDCQETERGQYRISEGIIRKVIEAGEPMVIPSSGGEPFFLNRTQPPGG
ncbi:MAG: hypothetical protein NC930_06305, partial [Candidatus Omnitrophica bacterium]|nr:hypothetical protein [Candidatus Omnitrophota bacterium]